MSGDGPPAPTPAPADAAAARLGMTMPAACRPGVEANLRLLDLHMRTLRGQPPRP